MGSNAEGKLGVGERSLANSNVPCLVEGISNISKIACGLSHTVAVSADGDCYSWG